MQGIRASLSQPETPVRMLAALAACLLAACSPSATVETGAASGDAKRKVVFVAGEDSHGPKAHEHAAGTRLLAEELRERYGDIDTVSVIGAWPEDETVFEDADALVLYCDGGKGHLINDHLERFNAMVEAGVGIAAIHYCVEVPKGSPSADAMLDAIGGYFETWWSVNPHWTARFSALPAHPIVQGVTSFSTLDEWYFNMRFREGVIPILSAVPPESTMERRNGPHSGNDAVRKQVADGVPQVVAWAYERPGGGRGFGYTGGHFHANWADDNARNTVLNAINWVAGAGDVP